MIFKVKYHTLGDHVHMRVFAGVDEDHLALAGALIMRRDEFRAFRHLFDRHLLEKGRHVRFVQATPSEVGCPDQEEEE